MDDKIQVLLPVVPKKVTERAANRLPNSLKGKVVGFLNNGTRAATTPLYEKVADLLIKNHQVSEIINRRKPYAKTGQGAPQDTLDELAEKCDLIINGIGL